MNGIEHAVDLEREWYWARSRVNLTHIRWLKEQGVPVQGMIGQSGGLCVGALPIEVLRDDSFVPVGDAPREALILPMDDDLLAFFPKTPATVYRRTGRYAVAGQYALAQAEVDGVLYVYPHMLDLMRAGFEGCVVVDWSADLRGDFNGRGIREIRCANQALGRRLKQALTRPYECPRITAPD